MSLLRARSSKKAVMLAVVAFAALASVAAAYSTTRYFYGSPGRTTMDESGVAANCHIWGLGYASTIKGCKGDNEIVADGHCPAGSKDGDDDRYCQIDQSSTRDETLTGGGGDNAIIGGGGNNTENGGMTGHNAFQTGPKNNTINGGPDGDAVNATEGSGTINLGKGTNVVYASSSGKYTINCTGSHDEVWMQPQDKANHCSDVDNVNGNDSRDRNHRKRRDGSLQKRTHKSRRAEI